MQGLDNMLFFCFLFFFWRINSCYIGFSKVAIGLVELYVKCWVLMDLRCSVAAERYRVVNSTKTLYVLKHVSTFKY